jgi:thioredoxin 1
MPLIELTNANFDEQIESNSLVILDFWAPWCAPCKAFAPIFEEAARRFPDILFAKINTDEETILTRQFEVRSIPTLLGAKDGTIVEVQPGALPPDQFEDFIQKVRKA